MNRKKVFLISFLCIVAILYTFGAVNVQFLRKTEFLFKSCQTWFFSDTDNKATMAVILSNIGTNFYNKNQITRIIHQSWKYNINIPAYFLRHIPSWKKCFPDWEYKFWTDEDNRNLILKHYSWFLKKYDSFPHSIYRADCARYFYMFHYGGIYTDLDNECLRPFEHLLVNHSFVFGDIDHVPKVTKLRNENYVQNSFMYSKPNHPFWLELVFDIYNNNESETPDIVTGPLVLSNMIQKYRDRYPLSHGIKIYESRYFNPITWGDQSKNLKSCKIWNGMSEKKYFECRKNHFDMGSYIIQYHSHTWG